MTVEQKKRGVQIVEGNTICEWVSIEKISRRKKNKNGVEQHGGC